MSIFSQKRSMILQKSLTKSLFQKIKEHVNFQNFRQIQIDENEKKMSKIIKKQKTK